MGQLKIGEYVSTKEGVARLTGRKVRPGRYNVYNIEVRRYHTYYVAKIGILVHNGCSANGGKGGAKRGIYEFPDQAAGGKPYVGQSGDISRRLRQHERAGRLRPGTETTRALEGGKTAREIAEHQRIQELTGGVPARQSPNVSNKVDPIGPKRHHLLGGGDK